MQHFLETAMMLDKRYIEERIQTTFLNFKPVDNFNTAIVNDGSTIALSAAMPGLVGATMRKGGRYAALRLEISQKKEGACFSADSGSVTVKMFNMIVKEIGPLVLKNGFFFSGKTLMEHLKGNISLLSDRTCLVHFNNKKEKIENLPDLVPDEADVFFNACLLQEPA